MDSPLSEEEGRGAFKGVFYAYIHNNVTISAPAPFHGIEQDRGNLNGGEGRGEIYG
jgi:hypothetical protein